ncbi:MAG TPA: serine hydrolase domain-containing protein [Thermomicrobiales bacterium]
MRANRFDTIAKHLSAHQISRRRALRQGGLCLAAGTVALTGATGPGVALRAAVAAPAAPVSDSAPAPAEDILAIARDDMARFDLRAVILRVTIDGDELVTAALGESITGVPATPEMHFRNGAVAIAYVATLLLRLVDQGVVGLDDPLAAWLPELPDAKRVSLRMLANMTAGYPDYVQNGRFLDALYADPFRQWTPEELIDVGISTPRRFEPGANWDYSHTNYVILGRALERLADRPLADLMQEQILDPLGLGGTAGWSTAAIPEPVLHAFSAERRAALGIDPAARFYEESTFWNPSWTLSAGAIQTTTIHDLTATAEAIGTGALLSPKSHRAQVSTELVGFGSALAGCPACHTLDERYAFGLGVVLSGAWILQSPLFGGYAATAAYLPSRRIAIAVATTFGEESFDRAGTYRYGNVSETIFTAIGAHLAPDEAPPSRR